MKNAGKGTVGYVRSEKIKRALIVMIMFAIPIGIYLTAYKITGTNRNIMTIVAILGFIPASRFAVSWIMIMLQKDADPEIVSITEQKASNLVRGYELTVTAYEGRMPLDAVVICGNEVVCFSSRGEKDKFAFMEKHITRIMNSNQYFGSNVKIFDSKKHYAERIRQLAENPEKYREGISFEEDERYPGVSREELMLHVIKAISV